MSDGRASFTSLLETIRNVYESDVCDEKSKAVALEAKVASLKHEKSQLKQQNDMLKNELTKQTKRAVRATRNVRLETRKYQSRISQLIRHLKFLDKAVQNWIKKIRALNLDSQFGSLADAEREISKTLTLIEELEIVGDVNDVNPDKLIDNELSSEMVRDEREKHGVKAFPPLRENPAIPQSMETPNSHHIVPGYRKTRVLLPAEQAPCGISKPQDMPGVSDPVSSLFLDQTALATPSSQMDSSQHSPEIPGIRALKHLGGKRTTKLGRSRKLGRYKYTDFSERKMKCDSGAVAAITDNYFQEIKGNIEEKDGFHMKDKVTVSEVREVQPQYSDTSGVMENVMMMTANKESEYLDGGWTNNLCTGLRTPHSDMTMVLFSEDQYQTIRPGDVTDESTCWESPCSKGKDNNEDDDEDEGMLREISTVLLNGSWNELKQADQGCPVLNQLVCYHVTKEEYTESDNIYGKMDAETPKIVDVEGTEKGNEKQLGDDLGFKYHEVIRKKDLRRQLKGHTCKCCEKFYEDQKLSPNSKQRLVKLVSRHRVLHTPPQTPPGFWSLRMPGSEECAAKGYIKDDGQRTPLNRKVADALPKTEGEDMSKNIAGTLKNRAARLY